MSIWTCSSCGYRHSDAEPPEKCPLCGAARERFKAADGGEESHPAKETEAGQATSAQGDAPAEPSDKDATSKTASPASGASRRWRCTICGYIHIGDAPPESCPLCGAASSEFTEEFEESADEEASPTAAEVEPSQATTDPKPTATDGPPARTAAPEGKPVRKWKCMACGYIHTGDTPPDPCPLCGASRDRFEEVIEKRTGEAEETTTKRVETATPATSAAPATRWKCDACGYIHKGAEPPEECPLCGADRDSFQAMEEPEAPPEASPETAAEPQPEPAAMSQAAAAARKAMAFLQPKAIALYEWSCEQILHHHLHPLMVHVPNGVGPMAVIFVLLAVLFDMPNLADAAHYSMIFLLISMPGVLFTGWVDWQRRYGGNMTKLFLTKIVCGGIVTACAAIVVIWRLIDPAVLSQGGSGRLLHLLVYLVMLGAAGVAGFKGGKLVFRKR